MNIPFLFIQLVSGAAGGGIGGNIDQDHSAIPNANLPNTKGKMNLTIHMMRCALCAAWLLAGYTASAGDAKTYQVTGPVLDVTPTTITVQKGSEKWQINRDASTKVATEPKVGSKVTVLYTMTATEIDAKKAKGSSK